MDRLKIGIISTSYRYYGFEGGIKKIALDGYDCIDYQGFIDIETDFFRLADEEFKNELLRQKELFSSHGLEISQAHAPWRTPKDGDAEERKRWIAAIKKAVRGTAILDCRRLIVHPLFPYMYTSEHPNEVWEMNEAFLSDLCDYAKAYGVTVCFENMPFKDFPIATVDHCIEMLKRVKRDNLKICLDTGHAAIFEGSDLSAAIKRVGNRLEAVHIHDNMGKDDEHLVPGSGIIDWDSFAGALKDIGFGGVISLETDPQHSKYPKSEWKQRELSLVKTVTDIAKKAF